eukprot:scaffold100494_cov66-Phaeocystis_antarctica.AAC.5
MGTSAAKSPDDSVHACPNSRRSIEPLPSRSSFAKSRSTSSGVRGGRLAEGQVSSAENSALEMVPSPSVSKRLKATGAASSSCPLRRRSIAECDPCFTSAVPCVAKVPAVGEVLRLRPLGAAPPPVPLAAASASPDSSSPCSRAPSSTGATQDDLSMGGGALGVPTIAARKISAVGRCGLKDTVRGTAAATASAAAAASAASAAAASAAAASAAAASAAATAATAVAAAIAVAAATSAATAAGCVPAQLERRRMRMAGAAPCTIVSIAAAAAAGCAPTVERRRMRMAGAASCAVVPVSAATTVVAAAAAHSKLERRRLTLDSASSCSCAATAGAAQLSRLGVAAQLARRARVAKTATAATAPRAPAALLAALALAPAQLRLREDPRGRGVAGGESLSESEAGRGDGCRGRLSVGHDVPAVLVLVRVGAARAALQGGDVDALDHEHPREGTQDALALALRLEEPGWGQG